MVDRKYAVVMMAGFVLAAAGLLLFVAIADHDYKYAIASTSSSPPSEATDIWTYGTLSDRQQAIFDRAVDGETVYFEDESPMPETVRKNGTYYTAESPRYYDWANPRTFGPLLLFLVGAAVSVAAVRTDVERWPV